MSVTKRVGLLAGAAAATVASGSFADGNVDQDNLLKQVANLEAKVAELSQAQNEQWLTEQRAAEIRGVVQDVLADADTRASLLQSGMTGGWDNGFKLRSADGNYELNVKGQAQIRFVWNSRDEASAPLAGGSNDWGFENRRTKLEFSGHVVDPSWKYKVKGAFASAGGGFALEDAYLQKNMDNGTYIRFGQFKAPYMREESVSSSKQLLVERSLVNERFNQGFTQGIEWGWSSEQFRVMVMLSDGLGLQGGADPRNTAALADGSDFALTGRAEFLAMGNWDQFDDFTSPQGSETGVMIGAAVNWEKDQAGTAAANNERYGITVDASAEFDGWNLYGAFVYTDDDGLVGNPLGFVVQGGFYFTEDLEGFARYEFGDLDGNAVTPGFDEVSVITVGVNKYFHGHALKWTTDVGFALDEIDAGWASGGSSWLADSEDSQVVLRTQFQVLF